MIQQPHWLFGVVFALLGLGLTLVAGRNLFKPQSLIAPFRGPILALEFARKPAEAAAAFVAAAAEASGGRAPDPATAGGGQLQAGRDWLKRQLDFDQKVVIPVYVATLCAASLLVWLCAPARYGLAAHAAGVALCFALTGAAAFFDTVENRAAREVIERTEGKDWDETRAAADINPALDTGRRAATAKFALSFGVLLVLAVPVLWRGGWGVGLAALLAAVAVFGFASLAPRFYAFVDWAFTLMGVCLLLAGVWLYRLPGGTT